MIDKRRRNKGVSEIVGTVLLLGIAIAMFTLVQLFAFALLDENPNSPSVRLIASIENGEVVIFHNGGESLPSNTKILFTINDDFTNTVNITVSDDDYLKESENSDKIWDIGEKVVYDVSNHPSWHNTNEVNSVLVMVLDISSNSVIMSTTIKE